MKFNISLSTFETINDEKIDQRLMLKDKAIVYSNSIQSPRFTYM